MNGITPLVSTSMRVSGQLAAGLRTTLRLWRKRVPHAPLQRSEHNLVLHITLAVLRQLPRFLKTIGKMKIHINTTNSMMIFPRFSMSLSIHSPSLQSSDPRRPTACVRRERPACVGPGPQSSGYGLRDEGPSRGWPQSSASAWEGQRGTRARSELQQSIPRDRTPRVEGHVADTLLRRFPAGICIRSSRDRVSIRPGGEISFGIDFLE